MSEAPEDTDTVLDGRSVNVKIDLHAVACLCHV